MRLTTAAVLTSLVLSACGGVLDSPSPSSAVGSEGAREQLLDGLDVFAASAAVSGRLANDIRLEVHPPGLLRDDEPLSALFTLTNTTEEDISIGELPDFAAAFEAVEGGGIVGVAGICGYAWRGDGRRVADDPCSAASPVSSVPANGDVTLPVNLFARTDKGDARPGRYEVQVPLSEDSALAITYELRPHNADALPAWPSPAAQLSITFEEVWLDDHDHNDLEIDVVVEDPYRRRLARRSLSDILESGGASQRPAWSLTVPPGVWRVVPLSCADQGWQRCGGQQVTIEDADSRELTLLLVGIDGNGPC